MLSNAPLGGVIRFEIANIGVAGVRVKQMENETRMIRIHENGGPEVLKWEAARLKALQPGQVRLRHSAVGLNFIDVYHRTGLYPVALPAIPGMEAAGVVEETGPGVEELQAGDRVAYAGILGAYSQRRTVAADRLVPLPEDISDDMAAAVMLKGLTAHYLIRKTFPVQAGQTILVHAACGGVGSILCQWAESLGARVIGTVGSDSKAELAKRLGCDVVIVYAREDFVKRVREETAGEGVSAVFDGVGKSTFEGSLDCLRPRGMMVSFGNASGPVAPFNLLSLSRKGSLFVTRPSLAHYTATRAELVLAAQELFDAIRCGRFTLRIKQRFPLEKASEAHRKLESRATTGSTLLIP